MGRAQAREERVFETPSDDGPDARPYDPGVTFTGPNAKLKVLVVRELAQPVGSMRTAAIIVQRSRITLFQWRKDDESFDQACKDAIAARVDAFEAEAARRAHVGVLKPVFQGGGCVGHVREFSDNLLNSQLRAYRPEMYNVDRVEHSGPGGKPIDHSVTVEFVNAPTDKKK